MLTILKKYLKFKKNSLNRKIILEAGMRKIILLLMIGLVLVFSLIITGEEGEITLKFYPEGDNNGRPFSEAVKVGDMLVLSGNIGIDPKTGKLADGGIQGESKQVMENIKTTLEKYGSSLNHVFKCTVMLADIKEWALFNKVYVTYFPNKKPARSAFGSSGLAMNCRVEVECWAVLK